MDACLEPPGIDPVVIRVLGAVVVDAGGGAEPAAETGVEGSGIAIAGVQAKRRARLGQREIPASQVLIRLGPAGPRPRPAGELRGQLRVPAGGGQVIAHPVPDQERAHPKIVVARLSLERVGEGVSGRSQPPRPGVLVGQRGPGLAPAGGIHGRRGLVGPDRIPGVSLRRRFPPQREQGIGVGPVGVHPRAPAVGGLDGRTEESGQEQGGRGERGAPHRPAPGFGSTRKKLQSPVSPRSSKGAPPRIAARRSAGPAR